MCIRDSHEGAGMVVPEALSFSLPVICFDNEGPGELMDTTCGFKVPYSNPEESIQRFSKYLHLLFHSEKKRSELSIGAKIYFEKHLTWKRKGKLISEAYREILNVDRDQLYDFEKTLSTQLLEA